MKISLQFQEISSTFLIAGESPNEDRSEGEDPASTPNTATTTSSPKKESDQKESEKIIPGKKFIFLNFYVKSKLDIFCNILVQNSFREIKNTFF